MATHAAFMPGAKVEVPTFWGAVASWLTTVDHKRIGILYGSSAFRRGKATSRAPIMSGIM